MNHTAERLRRAWRESVGGLPAAFWTIWVGTLIDRLGCFVVPFLAIYLTSERGFSEARAGIIVSMHGLGAMGGSLLGGILADRLGRRVTAIGGLLLGALSLIALAFARAPWAIGTLTLCSGMLYALYRPAVSAVITDVVPPEHRQRAFNHLYWAINLGFSISLLSAGLVTSHGFQIIFFADATTTLLFVAVLVWRMPETRPAPAAKKGDGGRLASGIWTACRDRVFMPFVVLSFLIGCVFSQWSISLPLAMRDDGLSAGTFGRLIALNGLLILVLQPFAPRILSRMRRSRGLALAALFVAGGFGLTALADAPPLYAVSILIWTLGEILSAPIGPSIVSDLSPADMRGSYQGVFSTTWGLASFAGPIAGAAVLGHWGGAALWLCCAGLAVLVAISHLVIAPARKRRLAGMQGETLGAPQVT